MPRTFISIDIPENLKKEIQKIQKLIPECEGKKTEAENLHLTLKFFGEVTEIEVLEIIEKLKEIKIKKFELSFEEIGVFSEDFIRIVWIHLKGAEGLQKNIDFQLREIFPKEKRFMGHLTIARIKKCDKEKFLSELKKIKIPEMKFTADKFNFKKSTLTPQGPKYEILEKFVLL